MNIAQSFAQYIASLTSLSLKQDIWIGEAPSSNKVTGSIYWIVASGGAPERLVSGENQKTYTFSVFYRSTDYEDVYNKLQVLEEQLNCSDCVQLDGYETIQVEAATLGVDDDLDLENRKVGLLQVNLLVYDNCED